MYNSEKITRPSRHTLLLAPAVFILLFTVDKISLIPAIHEKGKDIREYTSREFRRANEAKLRNSTKPGIVTLGSSRSERFSLLEKETELSEYLSPAEKSKLRKYTHVAYSQVGAQFYSYLESMVRLNQQNLLPDILIIEIAPEIFEKCHKNNTARSEFIFSGDYDLSLLWFLVQKTDGEIEREALTRILFPSYAVKWRPELALMRLGIPERNYFKPLQTAGYKRDYKDYLREGLTGQEKVKRVDNFLDMYLGNYREYDVDQLHVASFYKTIHLMKLNNKKVILFKPHVMPELQTIFDNTRFGKREKLWKAEFSQLEIPYLVLSPNDFSCKYWSDASHYSTRCTPQIMLHLLRQAGIEK